MIKSKRIKVFREIESVVLTVIASIMSALNLHIFIIPANFAPGGVDGISTMLQNLTGISAGWFLLIINLPLLIFAWFILKRRYVIYTILYTALSSLFLVVLENISFYQFDNYPNERLLIALFSGALLGIRTGMMLKIGGSTGGTDIVAGCITKKRPHINVEIPISILSCIIIIASGFVYGDVLSVMLSLVQMVIFSSACELVLRDTRNAVEVKIITKNPEKLTDTIIFELKHGATVTESKGLYTGEKSSVITTVINVRQIADLMNIIKQDESAFVYYTEAKGVRGNFRWRKDDEVK